MNDETLSAEITIARAKLRAELAIRKARDVLFGERETEAEKKERKELVRQIIEARYEEPKTTEVRKKLIPNWARKKWLGGR